MTGRAEIQYHEWLDSISIADLLTQNAIRIITTGYFMGDTRLSTYRYYSNMII